MGHDEVLYHLLFVGICCVMAFALSVVTGLCLYVVGSVVMWLALWLCGWLCGYVVGCVVT